MGLEVASFLNDLVPANPAGGDGKSQGDDHLRLIKNVLQNTFPGAVGARKFQDTDAGATDTLTWLLYRNSGSPLAADLLASFAVSGNSSTAVERVYARLEARADVVTNGAEFGSWLMKTMVNGAETIIGEFNSFRPITHQDFSTAGAFTWTKPLGCRKIWVEGCAGGGGSGAVNGIGANNSGATGGAASGYYGRTIIIDVSNPAIVGTTSGTIGSGGAAGVAPSGSGGNGTATTFVLNGVTYTWPGGDGSAGYVANVSVCGLAQGGQPAVAGTNVIGGSNAGQVGIHHADPAACSGDSGIGGGTPYGNGGANRHSLTLVAQPGLAGTGFGSGAGGALVTDTSADANGGAGRLGYLRFWEQY